MKRFLSYSIFLKPSWVSCSIEYRISTINLTKMAWAHPATTVEENMHNTKCPTPLFKNYEWTWRPELIQQRQWRKYMYNTKCPSPLFKNYERTWSLLNARFRPSSDAVLKMSWWANEGEQRIFLICIRFGSSQVRLLNVTWPKFHALQLFGTPLWQERITMHSSTCTPLPFRFLMLSSICSPQRWLERAGELHNI